MGANVSNSRNVENSGVQISCQNISGMKFTHFIDGEDCFSSGGEKLCYRKVTFDDAWLL